MDKTSLPNKKVTLNLVGLDGNAYSLMGAFTKQARREGWDKEEIDQVINQCTSGDYNNLLTTLMAVTQSEETDWDEEEE